MGGSDLNETLSREIDAEGLRVSTRRTRIYDSHSVVRVGELRGEVTLYVGEPPDDALVAFGMGRTEYLAPDEAEHIAGLLIASAALARGAAGLTGQADTAVDVLMAITTDGAAMQTERAPEGPPDVD